MDILPGDENEEERLFVVISDEEDDEDNNDVVSEGGGEDYFEEDNGMFTVFKNKVALDVLADKEILTSDKITDYYDLRRVQNTPLHGECLLIAIYTHVYLTQPKNCKRIMSRDGGWITPRIMKRLVDISVSMEQKFGKNLLGRGHWDEISSICELSICNTEFFTLQLKDTPKIPISKLRRENSTNELPYLCVDTLHC